jgi:uncharacterized membrane protein (UPF0127 family)
MEAILLRCKPACLSLLFLILAVLGWVTPAGAAPLIVHAGGSAYKFEVELATTPAEREQGLMFRKTLASNAGMLFLYPDEQQVAFWMKNTLIPLDMLFLKADGSIARIAHDAVPLDETPIPSNADVKAVLEVNGGTATALGIKEGDKVDYPNAPASN